MGSNLLLYKVTILLLKFLTEKNTNWSRLREESPEDFLALYEDGQFRSLYNVEIHNGYHDRLVVDKIQINRLWWASNLIRMGENGPAWKAYIYYMVGKEDVAEPVSNGVMTQTRAPNTFEGYQSGIARHKVGISGVPY